MGLPVTNHGSKIVACPCQLTTYHVMISSALLEMYGPVMDHSSFTALGPNLHTVPALGHLLTIGPCAPLGCPVLERGKIPIKLSSEFPNWMPSSRAR